MAIASRTRTWWGYTCQEFCPAGLKIVNVHSFWLNSGIFWPWEGVEAELCTHVILLLEPLWHPNVKWHSLHNLISGPVMSIAAWGGCTKMQWPVALIHQEVFYPDPWNMVFLSLWPSGCLPVQYIPLTRNIWMRFPTDILSESNTTKTFKIFSVLKKCAWERFSRLSAFFTGPTAGGWYG